MLPDNKKVVSGRATNGAPKKAARKLISIMNASAGAEVGNPTVARTTIVLPVAIDRNLELYALKRGLPKGEVIKRVLAVFLESEGMQPYKLPKTIDISYD